MKPSSVYNWLFSRQTRPCLLCLGDTASDRDICHPCQLELPWNRLHCRLCAVPMPNDGQLCGQCQTQSPAFTEVVAPFAYGFPVDSLIPAYKYRGQLTYSRLLSHLLTEALRVHYQNRTLPDCLVPMPLHHTRMARRGFNQATELARPVARALSRPMMANVLLRHRATQTQKGLSASDRRRNLRGAFSCRRVELIAGRHVALIDDVMTTGATVEEASRTLLAAGARQVSVWCVARTS